MGMLTPFLFRNDSIDALKNKKMQSRICEDIYDASMERKSSIISFHYPKGGIDVNPIECLGTKHTDEQRTIVVSGNSWIDLSTEAWGDLTRTDDIFIKYLKSCLKTAQQDITRLKNKLKELKE